MRLPSLIRETDGELHHFESFLPISLFIFIVISISLFVFVLLMLLFLFFPHFQAASVFLLMASASDQYLFAILSHLLLVVPKAFTSTKGLCDPGCSSCCRSVGSATNLDHTDPSKLHCSIRF